MNKRNTSDQFVKRPLAMLKSPAFRALSLTGHRILARIEIEHCAHRGKDNGALPVTHQSFRLFGIDRDAVAPGIREVEALGFTKITQRGIAGNAEYRRPNMFRQTYLPADGKEPTNEWATIKTIKQAKAIAAAARSATIPLGKTPTEMPQFQSGFSAFSVGKTQTENRNFQSGKPRLKG
jgi:hypothetical protein